MGRKQRTKRAHFGLQRRRLQRSLCRRHPPLKHSLSHVFLLPPPSGNSLSTCCLYNRPGKCCHINLPTRPFQTLPALLIFQDACYSTNPTADEQHASYTSYFDQLPPWGQDDSDLDNRFDGCSPASVWYISRHGSRNPTEDEIFLFTDRGPEIRDQVLANHEEGRGEMCQEDLDLLGAW